MKQSGFKKLKIWEKGMQIAKEIYEVTKRFPQDERFGLVSQMRRAAISVPSNIAEGYSRKNQKEFVQFLYIALGSLGELETQLLLAVEMKFTDFQEELFDQMDHLRSMTLKMCHR